VGSGSERCWSCCWRRRRKRRIVVVVVERSGKLKRRFLDLPCLVSRVRWLVASLPPQLLLEFERSRRPGERRRRSEVRKRESELAEEGERTNWRSLVETGFSKNGVVLVV